jgi:4-carboxymuconolactone decarboxylase
MSRLTDLHRDDLGDEGQALWDAIVTSRGTGMITEAGGLAGPFNAFLTAPKAGAAISELGRVLRFGTTLERRVTEVAILVIAARWRAEFEWREHTRLAREQGVPDAVVAAIDAGQDPPFAAADERAAYDVARELVTGGQLSPAAHAAARQAFGDEGTVELVALCGYYTLISFLLNAFEVPLPPGAEPHWPAP